MIQKEANLTDQHFKKLSADFFNSLFTIIRTIHVDIECIQDFNMGSLLSMIETDVEYDYIISNIAKYNEDFSRSISRSFPALGFTDEMIEANLNDSKYSNFITIGAPVTNLYFKLLEILEHIYSYTNRFEGRIPINVTFYSKIEYSETARARLIKDLTTISKKIKPSFVTGSVEESPINYVTQQDMLFIYDINKFINSKLYETISKSTPSFLTKYVMSPYQMDLEFVKDRKESLEYLFEKQEKGINLLFHFMFINRYLQIRTEHG